MTVTVQSGCSVRIMLERMGKTMFFRSGDHPLILTEEQREERKQGENHCSCFNAINGSGPAYLSKLLHISTPSRTLRSSSDTHMMKIQRYKRKTHGFCAFSCFGPHIWNSLQELRHCWHLLNPNSVSVRACMRACVRACVCVPSNERSLQMEMFAHFLSFHAA